MWLDILIIVPCTLLLATKNKTLVRFQIKRKTDKLKHARVGGSSLERSVLARSAVNTQFCSLKYRKSTCVTTIHPNLLMHSMKSCKLEESGTSFQMWKFTTYLKPGVSIFLYIPAGYER